MADDIREIIKKKLKKDPSSDEESSDEGSPPPVENKFANDGSFLELFKKKMAEEQANRVSPPPADPAPPTITPHTETEDGDTQLKAYQDGVGKRKTLLKTQQLRAERKRRREELEEMKRLEDEPQSTVWKQYMDQVKELKEKCCSEKDNHKRPLVK